MKKILVGMLALTITAGGCVAAAPRKSVSAARAQATQAANLFLWAWVTRDVELGKKMVSRDLARRLSADTQQGQERFLQHMTGETNPHHCAFEIGGCKMVTPTRATFRVVLFEHYAGERSAVRRESSIEVVAERQDSVGSGNALPGRTWTVAEPPTWKVNRLPE